MTTITTTAAAAEAGDDDDNNANLGLWLFGQAGAGWLAGSSKFIFRFLGSCWQISDNNRQTHRTETKQNESPSKEGK